jgi:hypothetical protein
MAQRMIESMGAQAGAVSSSVPPPLPGAKAFYAGIGGQQQGPFDLTALGERITAGQITPETLVWSPGMAGWTPAGQLPELVQLFAVTPPPLPQPK